MGASLAALATAAHAQNSPAQLSITRTAVPEVLQVLDHTGTWVKIGEVQAGAFMLPVAQGGTGLTNPSLLNGAGISISGAWPNQTISATGGGGGGAPPAGAVGDLQTNAGSGLFGNIPVTKVNDPAAGGMLATNHGFVGDGATDNSQFVSGLLAAIGPAGVNPTGNTSGAEVTLPAIIGQAETDYYFSQAVRWNRTGRLSCGGAAAWQAVALVFDAGEDGVVEEGPQTDPANLSSRGLSDIDGCKIASLGFGSGETTAGSLTITAVASAVYMTLAGSPLPKPWGPHDGIMAFAKYQYANGSPGGPTIPVGAYIDSATGALNSQTLTLHTGFAPTFSQTTVDNPNTTLYRLPAAKAGLAQTTAGSPTVTILPGAGATFFVGDIVWSDAFPFGSAVYTTSTATDGTQTLSMHDLFNQGVAVNATVTHAPGAEGFFWKVPAGIRRRMTAQSHRNYVTGWPLGLSMVCGNASSPALNCTGSADAGNWFQLDAIGKLSAGNNVGATTNVGNAYGKDYMYDIVEGSSTAGQAYFGDNPNSGESGTAEWSVGGYCNGFNYSLWAGNYVGMPSPVPYCISALGVPAIGSPLNRGPLMVAPQAGVWTDAKVIAATGIESGLFQFSGRQPGILTAAASASGQNVLTLSAAAPSWLYTGLTVTDNTTPAAIPASTTVTAISGSTVTLSNNIAAAGVLAGDAIWLSHATPPCIVIQGGLQSLYQMMFSKDCGNANGWSLKYRGDIGAWEYIQSTANSQVRYPDTVYTGYKPSAGPTVIYPQGLLLWDSGLTTQVGNERLLDMGTVAVPVANRLRGDERFNANVSPGGAALWSLSLVGTGAATAAWSTGVNNFPVTSATCTSPGAVANNGVNDTAYSPPKYVCPLSSCAGTTLTCTGNVSVASLGATDTLNFVSARPAAPVANDAGGTDYTVSSILRTGSSANKDMTGRIALVSGAASFTFGASNGGAPNCFCFDVTTPANVCTATESAASVNFTGTGTDTIKWHCDGRN